MADKATMRMFEDRDPGSGRRGEEGSGNWDKWDAAAARSAKQEKVELPLDVKLDDFLAFMPSHNYAFLPLRDFWPVGSVNARIPPVGTGRYDENGVEVMIKASTWLDQNRPCEQMSWLPGMPQVVRHFICQEGELIAAPGYTIFNTYRPPAIVPGDPALAQPWLDHVRRIYPNDVDHICAWCAQRVQFPQVKLNHALVLGGNYGIGKDTLLEPVIRSVGSWNCHEVNPTALLGHFTPFHKSVILRISEAHDLGETDIFAFYEHSKAVIAAPPNALRVNEKFRPEYHIPNLVGVIITTNLKSNGMYLPADDRRHYVAWSDHPGARDPGGLPSAYFEELWAWIEKGGAGHVAAYLRAYDLSGFNPKAAPPQTEAFFEICGANRSTETGELADALDLLAQYARERGEADLLVFTKNQLMRVAGKELWNWLNSKASHRQLPAQLEKLGFRPVENPWATDGLWRIEMWKIIERGTKTMVPSGRARRAVIYASRKIGLREQLDAAAKLQRRDNWGEGEDW